MDDAQLEDLVVAAAAGDRDAWHALWAALEPRLRAFLRRARIAGGEDDVRDLVVAVMGRLAANRFGRLHVYLAMRAHDPELKFMRWLIVVARRVTIDSVRAHPDYVDRRRSRAARTDGPGFWVVMRELHAETAPAAAASSVTTRVAAAQIMRRASVWLSDEQRSALVQWIHHAPSDARLVRSAVERLRRQLRRGELNP